MASFFPVSTGSILGASLLALPLGACFDIEQVDVGEMAARPPPRLIDDFDDDVDNSVRQPADAAFGPWHCIEVNGTAQAVRCDTAPGLDGTRGRVMSFDLLDRMDGERDYLGMELDTAAREPVDLSLYERFVFNASYQPAARWAPSGITVACLLYCSGLGTDAFVQAPVLIALDSAWYRYERNIAAFRQAQWQKDDWQREHRPLLDSDSCLDQVTAIGIALQPDMSDGVRAIADFVVDSIYVQ